MNKTIINGIDVSECCCFENNRCLWSKRYYENNNVAPPCEAVKNCYFKQFKRLEQERNELQDKYSKMIHKYNDLYEKYRAKEILEPDLKNEIKKFDALSIKYGQALEEIRKAIGEKYGMADIIKIRTILDEVLNDRD